MFMKLFAGLFASAALVLAAVGFAESKSADCCTAKMACCAKNKACCSALTKLGCCVKGMKCCSENRACCAAAQKCCNDGAACCNESKACCGPAAKSADETDEQTGCDGDHCEAIEPATLPS